MARVRPFGWHANIQLDGRELPQYEAQIKRLDGKFVIDHVGKFLEPVAPDHAAFKSLLHLLDTGRCWVKLSAPYETSKTGAPKYEDVGRLAKALVKHAPERMMWASNWPHPSAPKDAIPDDADLVDLLAEWAPDDGRAAGSWSTTRKRSMGSAPARVFHVAVGESAEVSKTLTRPTSRSSARFRATSIRSTSTRPTRGRRPSAGRSRTASSRWRSSPPFRR